MAVGTPHSPGTEASGDAKRSAASHRETRRGVFQTGLAAAAAAFIGPMSPQAKGQTMTPEQREAMIRRYIEQVFNGHDLDGLDAYWATDLVSHWMGQETLRGLPAWREGMVGFFAAFPDATYTLEDLFVADDRGVWRGAWRATQRGPWAGVAPSDREVSWTVIIIGRFAGDKLAEDWVEYDRLGLFQQLGAIPIAG
jgi:predicted ester cyclase